MERDHRFYAVGRDRRSWEWENIPRRSGCGRAMRGGRYARLRRAGGHSGEREAERRAEAEGRTEQPTTARRCSVVAWIRMLSDSERRPSATACPLTAALLSVWSASRRASSTSPTSRNAQSNKEVYARCSRETSIEWLPKEKRPSGRLFVASPLSRPSAIYARLKNVSGANSTSRAHLRTPNWGKKKYI